MLCGHNATEGEETTLAFTRIAGAGANQREFATSKADATVNWLNKLRKCANICIVWLWGPQQRQDHHFSQVDT